MHIYAIYFGFYSVQCQEWAYTINQENLFVALIDFFYICFYNYLLIHDSWPAGGYEYSQFCCGQQPKVASRFKNSLCTNPYTGITCVYNDKSKRKTLRGGNISWHIFLPYFLSRLVHLTARTNPLLKLAGEAHRNNTKNAL